MSTCATANTDTLSLGFSRDGHGILRYSFRRHTEFHEGAMTIRHLGMAQNKKQAGVTRVLVFGSIYQGAILVPLF